MGNQRNTNEADHRLYTRPAPGETGDWVEVVADGGDGLPSHRHDGGEFSDTDMDGGRPAAAVPPRSRFNPYLAAAWAVVALMLGVGLFWLFDTSQLAMMYGSASTVTRTQMTMINFHQMGMYMLPFGLAGALALLAVQAVGYRRGSRE